MQTTATQTLDPRPGRAMDEPAGLDLLALTRRWYCRARAVEKAHFRRCVRYQRRQMWLGGVSVVMTSLLGALANTGADGLGGISAALPGVTEAAAAVFGVVAPIVAGLLAFLKLEEKSAMHHNAGARFASLKRRLQIMMSSRVEGRDEKAFQKRLEEIRSAWDELTLEAPALHKTDWREVGEYDREVEARFRRHRGVPVAEAAAATTTLH